VYYVEGAYGVFFFVLDVQPRFLGNGDKGDDTRIRDMVEDVVEPSQSFHMFR
jgi:hypothetical protein